MNPAKPLRIALKKLQPEATIPKYQTAGAAGFDFHACMIDNITHPGFPIPDSITIPPGRVCKIRTGIAVSIGDPGWALKVMARSGLASQGISLANGVGLVDSDYQGDLSVLLENRSAFPFRVAHGDRIAQGVFERVQQAEFVLVDDFAEKTERGAGGFGSTGVRTAADVMMEAAVGAKPDITEQFDDEEDGTVVEAGGTLEGTSA